MYTSICFDQCHMKMYHILNKYTVKYNTTPTKVFSCIHQNIKVKKENLQ